MARVTKCYQNTAKINLMHTNLLSNRGNETNVTNWLTPAKTSTPLPQCKRSERFPYARLPPAPHFGTIYLFALFGFNELQIMSFGVNHLPNTRLFSVHCQPPSSLLSSLPQLPSLPPLPRRPLSLSLSFSSIHPAVDAFSLQLVISLHLKPVYFSRIAFDDLLFFSLHSQIPATLLMLLIKRIYLS